MKFIIKIIFIFIFALRIGVSEANTLLDSLSLAYKNNPKLNAERAGMRASKEAKRESVSEFLPNVTISGYVSDQQNTKTDGSDSNFKPAEQSMTIEQKSKRFLTAPLATLNFFKSFERILRFYRA